MYKIKVLHKYFFSGEISKGPLYVSVEILVKYDFNKDKNIGEKKTVCIYNSPDETMDQKLLSTIEIIEDIDEIMDNIMKLNLTELKNNYFTDKNPERFTHWELEYDLFKIVGTYDNEITEFKEISKLLDLDAAKKYYEEIIK